MKKNYSYMQMADKIYSGNYNIIRNNHKKTHQKRTRKLNRTLKDYLLDKKNFKEDANYRKKTRRWFYHSRKMHPYLFNCSPIRYYKAEILYDIDLNHLEYKKYFSKICYKYFQILCRVHDFILYHIGYSYKDYYMGNVNYNIKRKNAWKSYDDNKSKRLELKKDFKSTNRFMDIEDVIFSHINQK